MTEDQYFRRVYEQLGGFAEVALASVREGIKDRRADCWAFVVYPERFQIELGIELRWIRVNEDNSTEQGNAVDALSGAVSYCIGDELNPQDFSSSPENRFELVTQAAIQWIEGFIDGCDFQSPVYCGGPDDLHFYSFQDKKRIRLPFWI